MQHNHYNIMYENHGKNISKQRARPSGNLEQVLIWQPLKLIDGIQEAIFDLC